MLIIDACIDSNATPTRLRVEGERIVAIRPDLKPHAHELVIESGGAAVLPGLHDHHLHLLAYAAALDSVWCGPPAVFDADSLGLRLAAQPGSGWIRGVGYHESVAGEIDRSWLDRHVSTRPLRIQHRSGQLWIFNSAGLRALGIEEHSGAELPFERVAGILSGRLYGADHWLRQRLGGTMPDLMAVSTKLAAYGITGVTDAGPANAANEFAHFAAQRQCGNLRQEVLMMGGEELDPAWSQPGLMVGADKIHLREVELPDFDQLCARVERSHQRERPVAIHCVSEAELVFALAVLQRAGTIDGDRLEHAALASPATVEMVAAAGVRVVTQPNFIYERGDTYLHTLDPAELSGLYRTGSFLAAGVAVAAGSDAPYGDPDPWRSIATAMTRSTRSGQILLGREILEWQQALRLYTSPALAPGAAARRLAVGEIADLCITDRSWAALQADPASVLVRFTIGRGELIYAAQDGLSSIASIRPH